MSLKTQAVMEIGSTGIRVLVANIHDDGNYEILDKADKPVALGRDVFTTSYISGDSIRECIAVLNGFTELLTSYGICPKDVHIVATSAVREAENRDALIDRVAIRTGYNINVIEAIEESHYQYLAVYHTLGEDVTQFSKANSIIIEVGGGSTELILLRRGKIVGAHSFHLGTVRIEEQTRSAIGFSSYILRYLRDNVSSACDSLDSDMHMLSIKSFIVIGSDARFAAKRVGIYNEKGYSVVSREKFLELVDKLKSFSIDGLVREYRIPYSEAESLLPGLVIISLFVERTGAEQIVVPDVSLRDGIMISVAQGAGGNYSERMHTQIIASVTSIGRHYHFDENHAIAVAKTSLFLFDKLDELHGMNKKDRLLLEVASLLHDVGSYIRASGHHRHSEYIVNNSELFGITQDELLIIANLVRYHRGSVPLPSHPSYMSLTRENRTRVFKLGAILRISEALDRGHAQRFKLVNVEIKEDHVLIHTDSRSDLTLERLALGDKTDMFEEVFGLKVVII